MRVEELSKTLDHTVLGSDAGEADIRAACGVARELHFASVCSYPRFLPIMAQELRGCDVKTCAVIAFPEGRLTSSAKAAAVSEAIMDGADELDIVMNVAAMRAGDFKAVRDDLRHVINSVRGRAVNDSRGGVIIKAIIEAPLLDDKLVRLACKIVDDCGADFAKTCTGVGTAATVHDVELMRDALSERVGVKAAGGIRTLDDAEAMVNAGATRVGSSSADAIVRELMARENGG